MIIEIPEVQHFQYGHGRDLVKKRKRTLDKVQGELRRVQDWLAREYRYLEDNCIGHTYQSTGDGDGSSVPWCKDCGAAE